MDTAALLSVGYFEKVELTEQQRQWYRKFSECQIEQGLDDEFAHVRAHRLVDSNTWKPIRSKHDFHFYRRRDTRMCRMGGQPNVLGVGYVEGSIEDVLFGAEDVGGDDLSKGITLTSIDDDSAADTFRCIGIKWVMKQSSVKADRDWVLLESMGISTQANGKRFGYHTLFSVDLPQCPAVPGVVRGTVWCTSIYRDAGHGMLNVFSQGYDDSLGDYNHRLRRPSWLLSSLFRHLELSETKKLTMLALQNFEWSILNGQLPLSTVMSKSVSKAAVCCICIKPKSFNPFSSHRLSVCGVCSSSVCRQCHVKKCLIAGQQRVCVKVPICHLCLARTKGMIVHPKTKTYEVLNEHSDGHDYDTLFSTVSSTFDALTNNRHFNDGTLNRVSLSQSYNAASSSRHSAYTRESLSGCTDGSAYTEEPLSSSASASVAGGSTTPFAHSSASLPCLGKPQVRLTSISSSTPQHREFYSRMVELHRAADVTHDLVRTTMDDVAVTPSFESPSCRTHWF